MVHIVFTEETTPVVISFFELSELKFMSWNQHIIYVIGGIFEFDILVLNCLTKQTLSAQTPHCELNLWFLNIIGHIICYLKHKYVNKLH